MESGPLDCQGSPEAKSIDLDVSPSFTSLLPRLHNAQDPAAFLTIFFSFNSVSTIIELLGLIIVVV